MAKILPVFLPFASCGNKCIFCDQQAISGVKAENNLIFLAENQIKTWFSYSLSYDEIAFYGGNFAAVKRQDRERLYRLAYDNGLNKIRFSTRPDTINNETLAEIKDYNISLVELGIQSLDNNVLEANGRPYTNMQAEKAVDDILNITDCGVQLMTGMYKQSLHSCIDDAANLSKKNIKTARIYPTQVLKNTVLYSMYLKGGYKGTDLADMILAAGGMYAHFTAENVRVIRMGLPEDAADNGHIAAGAYHKSFGDIVKTFIMLLYMDMGGKVRYSGFKKTGRKLFSSNYELYPDIKISDFKDICIEIRRNYLENSKWFIKGKAASFACKLKSAANN
ncbi:MAG: radical SAM protein [Mucispirillum sp.]|nr:radical SAM protein [Mucispirillum sp.]